MRRVMAILLLSGFAGIFPAFAEHEEKGMDKKGMMGHGMMGMMSKAMVASGDGGVIVQSGNKLLKYDKDLNLVKEAEIPMDMGAMKKEMCPMCAKKMAESKDTAENPDQSTAGTASEADHAAHH